MGPNEIRTFEYSRSSPPIQVGIGNSNSTSTKGQFINPTVLFDFMKNKRTRNVAMGFDTGYTDWNCPGIGGSDGLGYLAYTVEDLTNPKAEFRVRLVDVPGLITSKYC
jgi:hypothetical protein